MLTARAQRTSAKKGKSRKRGKKKTRNFGTATIADEPEKVQKTGRARKNWRRARTSHQRGKKNSHPDSSSKRGYWPRKPEKRKKGRVSHEKSDAMIRQRERKRTAGLRGKNPSSSCRRLYVGSTGRVETRSLRREEGKDLGGKGGGGKILLLREKGRFGFKTGLVATSCAVKRRKVLCTRGEGGEKKRRGEDRSAARKGFFNPTNPGERREKRESAPGCGSG